MTHELMLLNDLPKSDVFEPLNARLREFEVQWIESAETFRLVHEPCGEQMFDVEHDDGLDVYLRMALEHHCSHRSCIWDLHCGWRGIAVQDAIDHAWEKHAVRERHALRDLADDGQED